MLKFENRYEAVAYLKEHNKENKWYVYMLVCEDVPFYVGVAKNNKRLYQHEKDAQPYAKRTNPLKERKIRSMWRKGIPVKYVIVKFFHSTIEVQHAERSLIMFYGQIIQRTGILTNILEGGDGALGRPASDKQKEAVRLANTGKVKTEETIKRLSESQKKRFEYTESPFKGRHHTEETKKLMSERMSGENHPHYGIRGEDHFNYGRPCSEEKRLKIIQTKAENPKPCTDDRKQKLRDYWNSQPVLVCPHCGKESSFKPSMLRAHFDNCKLKVNQPFEADTFANVN